MSDGIVLSLETYNRLMRAVEKVETMLGGIEQQPNTGNNSLAYAKITEVIETENDDTTKKEAKGVEVVWDEAAFDWRELNEEEGEPYIYDNDLLNSSGATLFNRTNITSKTAMVQDKVYALQYYPNLSEDNEWLVVETGGAAREWVVITAVNSPSSYVGDVYDKPGGSVKETGVDIGVFGASTNEYNVGYGAFADKSEDIYYIDGYLLG